MTTVNVYLSKYDGMRAADLTKATQEQLARLTLNNSEWIKKDNDYVLVGTAEVTVTLMPQDAIVQTQIVALRAQQDNIKATAHAHTVEIERQIQSLLAITNEVQA
jgi:glycine cleavage system H lipoate-binding protein